MKILNLTFSLFAFFLFSNLNAQKTNLNLSEVPGQISTFVSENFTKSNIESVYKDVKESLTEFKVKLTTGEKLEFDQNYAIKEIEARNGVPDGVVSQGAKDYVNKNYPGQKITEWEAKSYGEKIELKNGTDLKFDKQGKLLEVDK